MKDLSFSFVTDDYLADLRELSYEYPILAYRLNGRDNLIHINKGFEDFARNICKTEEHQPITKTNDLIDLKISQSYEKSKEALRSDILSVAWMCGILTYFKIKFSILMIVDGQSFDEFEQKMMDEMVPKMEDFISEAERQPLTGNHPLKGN